MLQLAAKRGWTPHTRAFAASPDKHKYAASVNLPQTTFSMRAEAGTREVAMQEFCTDALYRWQHETRTPPHPQFILHDGPPFANGALHVGHFLNKVCPGCMSSALLVHRITLQPFCSAFRPGVEGHYQPLQIVTRLWHSIFPRLGLPWFTRTKMTHILIFLMHFLNSILTHLRR